MPLTLRLVLSFLIALVCAVNASAAPKWLRSESPHFEMLSTAPDWESRKLLAELEQFRESFLDTFHLRRARDPRTTVVVFDSERQFEPYMPLYNGKPKQVGGYFVGFPDETVIAMVTRFDYERSRETIFHEYVHLLLHSREFLPPAWLNEGLAELYSTFKIGKDVVEIGQPKARHLALLQRTQLMPLEKLFAVTHASHAYNEGPDRALFYAQSWALLHFWVCGAEYKDSNAVGQFLTALEKPNAVPEVCFREAFGKTYAQMEGALRAYVRAGSFFLRRGKITAANSEKSLVFKPATDFERDVALANLKWRTRRTEESLYQLQQLADREPTSARPYEVMASIRMQEKDRNMALDHWKRSAELNSTNAYVYLQLAKDIINQFMSGVSLDYRMPEPLCVEMRGWLDRAVNLSPDYVEAYEALATVEAFSPQPRIAVINDAQAALKEMRDPWRTLATLAVIRWRVGDLATSQKIVDGLLENSAVPPPVKALARQLHRRLAKAAANTLNPAEPATP